MPTVAAVAAAIIPTGEVKKPVSMGPRPAKAEAVWVPWAFNLIMASATSSAEPKSMFILLAVRKISPWSFGFSLRLPKWFNAVSTSMPFRERARLLKLVFPTLPRFFFNIGTRGKLTNYISVIFGIS